MRNWGYEQILRVAVDNPTSTDFNLPQVAAGQGSAQAILTVVFGLAAAITVLVIIIAGFNLVTSEGEPDKISRSKKAIIYALIGLILTISAEIIIQLVLTGI